MNSLLISIIAIVLVLILIYIIVNRASKTKRVTKRSDRFPGQVDDPSEAITSNVKLEQVEDLIKRDFPPEKHAEVVDALGNYNKGYRATTYHIILSFATSDIDKVREYVKIADEVGDYRDLAQALTSLAPRQDRDSV